MWWYRVLAIMMLLWSTVKDESVWISRINDVIVYDLLCHTPLRVLWSRDKDHRNTTLKELMNNQSSVVCMVSNAIPILKLPGDSESLRSCGLRHRYHLTCRLQSLCQASLSSLGWKILFLGSTLQNYVLYSSVLICESVSDDFETITAPISMHSDLGADLAFALTP